MQWVPVVAIVLALLALAAASYAAFFPSSPSLIDMEEFKDLNSEIKQLYKDKIVKELAPAAMTRINKEWDALPKSEKDKLRNFDMAEAIKQADRAQLRRTARPLVRAVTAVTTPKPTAAARK